MLAAWGGVIGCWNAFVTVMVTMVMMVLMVAFDLAFIIMYALNLKHMKQ